MGFNKGDKVTCNAERDYNGVHLASFVRSNTYEVMQVNGDRVVIGRNGVVTAAVKASELNSPAAAITQTKSDSPALPAGTATSKNTSILGTAGNFAQINLDNTEIYLRLLEGEFINYRQVIPSTTSTTILVNKAQLEDGLERASLLARMDKNNLVKFDIRDKILTLTSASNIGNVTENITISLDGKDLVIAFNARYLSDCMHSISDEFIKINFTSQIAPCTICSAENDKYLYLILPVRIVE